MFNLIAICVTFPLLTYAAYKDITHPKHLIPNWIWFALMPIGLGLLLVRTIFLTPIEAFTASFTIILMTITAGILWNVRDSQGNPQLGGADIKCFLCLTMLFPTNLVPLFVGLFSITPFIFLSRGPFRRIGRHFPFLPFILLALPFAIITGMIVM